MVQARPRTPIQELLRRMPYTLHVGNVPGGRAEFVSIQAAINYADAQGGDWTILIYPGTYDEGDITPAGGANITLKAMGEGRVVIAPAAAPVTAVIVSGWTLALEDLIVTAPDATRPALTVNGSICTANNCQFNGVGAGDSIDLNTGTLNMEDCAVNCDIELSTNPCTLTAIGCAIAGGINTAAQAIAHVMTLYDCDLAMSNIVSAATGATTLDLYGCTQVGTVNNSGTGAFTIRDSDITTINHVNAAGTVTLYGGYLHTVTRAVGSVVWWKDRNIIHVLPSGTITDTVIGWAVAAAGVMGAPVTVVVGPGTYEEAVTLIAGINLVGVDKESCIINIDHATLITMAEGCYVANLTLDVTGDGTGNGIGIALNNVSCTIHDLIINLTRTDNGAWAIYENTGDTAKTIYVRNVRISSTDTDTRGIHVTRLNKTVYIENCWVDCYIALGLDGTSTIYSDHNLWDGASNSISISAGTIQMTEDTVLGGAVSQLGGTCTYRDSHDTYHVFLGMYIQDALTAGAGGEVVIHEGTHEPPNPGAPGPALTVSANTLVRGQGFGTIVQGDGAATNITNLLLLNGNNIHIKDIKLNLEAGCGTAGARPNVIYASGMTLIWLENLWVVGDTSVDDDGSDDRQCGIMWDTVTESKIVDCRSEDNKKNGIRLMDSSNNNTIAGNTCQGNTGQGIYLYTSSNNTVTGNTCQGNTGQGIYLYTSSNNNTIAGNTCQGNAGYGAITLQTESNNNTVTGNTCQGNTQIGIYLIFDSNNNTVTGNTCADNDSGGNTYSGIVILSCAQNVISGNQSEGNGLHGIYIFRSSYCTITGNVCNNQNTGDGIRVTGDASGDSDENAITGNVCRGNASDGIEIAGGAFADRNSIVANQLLGNTANPLVDGGTNTTIDHNVTV